MAETPAAPARPRRVPRTVTVVAKEQVTPNMIRIVFGGDGLAGFGAGEFTDHYVKLQIPEGDDGATRTRTYTVRGWDAERGELTVDFVVHGDEGYAGPWAAAAQPGDTLQLTGPGGAYAPDPDAAWHLMVGDPSVIPAISASLARIPDGVPVHVLIEVDGPDDEQPLATPGDLHLTWTPGGPGAIVDVLESYTFPEGPVSAFVHGEASTVRAVRRHLLVERAIPREALSISGYWKLSRTEEGWREDKADWNRLVEEDVAAAAPSSDG
ncbi:MAG TPA: siderophore-interacting protein [Baekduia sp.]